MLTWIHHHFDFVGQSIAAFAVVCCLAAALWRLETEDPDDFE